MPRRLLLLVPVVISFAAAPAVADQAKSVTATGSKLVKVVPKNRHRNASIQAAVEAAEKAGITGALSSAHDYALRYAAAAGLTLGSVISVSDAQNNGPYFGPGPYAFFGPFGPNQYCGIRNQPVFKVVHKKRKLVRFKRVHVCIVPAYEATTLTVTYSAT
jgi:hypothetical protein